MGNNYTLELNHKEMIVISAALHASKHSFEEDNQDEMEAVIYGHILSTMKKVEACMISSIAINRASSNG